MDSKVKLNKVLLNIQDCVSELKRLSVDKRTSINDDSTTLHRFQEQLELILLFGLIEKPGFLGPKKSYWNYICSCFTFTKRSHDGINFVKSLTVLKTPLGRGRAFIRFCLMQKCLADTLQNCFMCQKISRDFYVEQSLPVQKELWSTLIAFLYELNELNFDLCTGHAELDFSWPKFARKHFASDSEKFCSRNMSAPNLLGLSSQKNLNAVKLTELNEELSEQNKWLQKEVHLLKEEKFRLQYDIETLQKKYTDLQQQLSNSFKEEHSETEFNQVLPKVVPETSSYTPSAIKDGNSSAKNVESESQEFGEHYHSSVCVSPSVKSKIKSDISRSCCEHNLQQNDQKEQSNSPDMCSDTENFQTNRNVYIQQNSIYIGELLSEMKTVIDDIEDTVQKSDITLVIPHISHLKRIRNCLEEKCSSEIDKSKKYLSFTNLVENFISYIKKFIIKQENIINSLQEGVAISLKGNQNLYARIRTLKDLLQSYGFLKITNEKEIQSENILPFDASGSSKFSYEDFSCDIANNPALKRIIIPLLPDLNSSLRKLNTLNEKIIELQFGLESSQMLNNNLITRVQDQEMHLKGVTKEIEEAQQLVSVLKKQHRKLQSAEGILKYDLQEKRKLLTRLKQQLEDTREDFNLVHIKNSKSEAEWRDLRKEFFERHKQTSEESGFVDDKILEDHETVFLNSTSDCNFSQESTSDCSFSQESTSDKGSLNKDLMEMPQEIHNKRKRLELLEEQCQNLYSNLLLSSKKRQEIDKRLEDMCKKVEKNNDIIQSDTFSSDLSAEISFETTTDATIQRTSEDKCQNIMFKHEAYTSSPHSSLDVGSLNCECSSCLTGTCNDASSCDSSKADSYVSFSSELPISTLNPVSTVEQINNNSFLQQSTPNSYGSDPEYKEGDERISSCEFVELTADNIQNSQSQIISHVDSILTKKKDLEESLKNLDIDKYSQSAELSMQICTSHEEKQILLSKIQELEKRILLLSTELDETTRQLVLSKAANENEVAALQFHLNTQALKYERSLKDFSEQSKGLQDMKQRVGEQEQLILALEDALSEIRLDRENEKEHHWQELEDIHTALEVREQECITLCQELQNSMSEVEQEQKKNKVLLSQLEECKTYNQKDKEMMEAEVLYLKQYSGELQKKLIKLLKEKDILWKRNNHLYHLQKIKFDDRWMKDSEVSSCLSCKNNFSFMLRKHHCRLCGRIFCYSCSNNWLLTASSSKKIRVCNECLMQHMEIKKVVRRGSDVPHIEDDNENEADKGYLSFIPASSSSFNYEVPSSVTDSIISLPITQKQSTPHFASAPDLHYVCRPDSISLADEKGKMSITIDDVSKTSEISSDECTPVALEDDLPKSTEMEISANYI